MKRNSRFRGIVVAADNAAQAMDHYRAVASGDCSVLESDDGSFCFATANVAGIQLLNPLNGEELTVLPEDKHPDMTAVASDAELDVNYIVCTDGCGSHVIADDVELLAKCPACASDLPKLEDTELKTKNQPKEIFLAFASGQETVVDEYRKLLKGEIPAFASDCDGVTVISNKPLKYDIYKAVAANNLESYEPKTMAAFASAESGVSEVNYFTTASDTETVHVLCSDESPLFCPETSSGLIDPADIATASDEDEEDEDEDEDEEDEDEEETEEDEEETEEDEESEEDDSEDEDEGFDDEDEDLTLSLSSDKGGVRRKPATPKKLVSVAASFVAIASDKMNADSVEVAYAGSIKNDLTWIAFFDGVPFAKATASSSKQKDLFADPVFARTFQAIANEQGVPTALVEMGFEEIKPQINVEQHIEAEINAQVEQRSAALAEASSRDSAELSERFEAALASAAQGINRGFFPTISNPIRVALASTFEEVGIQGGDELIAKAFVENSDGYNKLLLAKASEIIKYDLEVQNQLANAIQQVQETNVATASSVSVGRAATLPGKQPQKMVATASAQNQNEEFSQRLASLSFGSR